MDGLKGLAEILEHILYEVLGLLIPGAALTLVTAWLLGPESWEVATRFVTAQPWIGIGVAYLLGFVVQGVSRPAVASFEWILRLPARILWWAVRGLAPGPAARLTGWREAIERVLLGRHKHGDRVVAPEQRVELDEVARVHWQQRLALPEGRTLSVGQVRDLSFSEVITQRGRLDRFRAATSLCRGVAVSVVVAFVLVTIQMIAGDRPVSLGSFLLLEGLVVAFYALLERADMYDRLWNAVLLPQFLAHATRPKSGTETPAP